MADVFLIGSTAICTTGATKPCEGVPYPVESARVKIISRAYFYKKDDLFMVSACGFPIM